MKSTNTIRVLDGGNGGGSGNPDKAAIVIGISSIVPQGLVTVSSVDEVEEKFGDGTLRDFLVDAFSFESPGVCYVKAISGSIDGKIGTVTSKEENQGVGSVTVTGKSSADHDYVVEIVAEGGLNEAGFTVTADERIIVKATTIPEDGVVMIGHLKLTFQAGTAVEGKKSFITGDQFCFTTTAPEATNEELLNAIDEALAEKRKVRIVAVAQTTSIGFWSAFDSRLGQETAKNRFLSGLTLARDKKTDETVDEYVNAMTGTERGIVQCKRLNVVLSSAPIADAKNGNTDIRNVGGKYLGWLLQNKIQESPGKTALDAVPGILGVRKYAENGKEIILNDAQISLLDDAGFITVCTYAEKDGVYFTSGRMLCDMSSDFSYVQHRAVMDKACSKVAAALFKLLQKEEKIGADGTLAGLSNLQAIGQAPLNDMANSTVGEISSGTFVIPKNQDILKDKLLKYKVSIIPLGYLMRLEGEIGFINPYVNK